MAKLYLSYEEFESYAKDFIAVSTKLRDGWKERRVKVASSPERETLFLTKSLSLMIEDHTVAVQERDANDHHSSLEQLVGDESIEEEDDPAIISSSTRQSSGPCHIKDHAESTPQSTSQEAGSSAQSPLSVHMEYHIVHSFSYEVPVLYFNATYSNGKQLTLEDTWKLLSKQFVSSEVDRWGLVSQQEHPLLHCPFYHVHPCHTAKVMGQALKIKEKKTASHNGGTFSDDSSSASNGGGKSSSREKTDESRPDQASSKCEPNYLITWLSSFGPLVGLTIPLEYATC